MAAVQSTIPFKARKRTRLAHKQGKDENEDVSNTSQIKKEKALKRRKELGSIEINENDTCSAVKIARVNEAETEEQQCTDSLKPLTSREKETEFLEKFLMEHLESEKSASLYISGQPGTGKTATLTYLLQVPKVQEGYKHVYVNCTMIKSAASVYNRICKELQLQTKGSSEKACLTAIEKYLTKKHKMILLVLDEIDQLDSKRQSVLYTVFEWPSLTDSRVVLIGVANALDLTERTLPRLQARCSLRPTTLHFAPYTKKQIVEIFTAVLTNEDKGNLFTPTALSMMAGKIASVSGDMRRALDICRRIIDLAKRQLADKPLHSADPLTVQVYQVLQVTNNLYCATRDLADEDDLPMQQKLILGSLMLMLTKGKNKDINMGRLHDVYKKVSCARNIEPLDMCSLSGACGLLEARGAVRLGAAGAGGGARARRVRLLWDEGELAGALRDKPLLAAILNDVNCL